MWLSQFFFVDSTELALAKIYFSRVAQPDTKTFVLSRGRPYSPLWKQGPVQNHSDETDFNLHVNEMRLKVSVMAYVSSFSLAQHLTWFHLWIYQTRYWQKQWDIKFFTAWFYWALLRVPVGILTRKLSNLVHFIWKQSGISQTVFPKVSCSWPKNVLNPVWKQNLISSCIFSHSPNLLD